MAELYIYEQDADSFADLGLCGRLDESRCEYEEVANGMAELTVEHPLDAWGRHLLLTNGRILKAVVPVRSVPEVDPETSAYYTVAETWTIKRTATKNQRTVWNKRASTLKTGQKQKKKKVLKAGSKVTVTVNYGELDNEWKIKCGKVTGFIDSDALENKVTQTPRSGESVEHWFERVTPSWTAKEQLFRIYDVRRNGKEVTVRARHIFYDNLASVSTYEARGAVSLPTVLRGIANGAVGDADVNFFTNISAGTLSGAHYRNRNVAEAILDPEDGCAARWQADVIRDDEDCYLISQAGFDRGVVLEAGYDLVGVDYRVNDEDVVTHLRPVGEQENGEPLYLTSTQGLVASPRAAQFPFRRVAVLPVNDAKVKKKDGVTAAICRTRMQQAANEAFAAGADQPEVSVSVHFALLGDAPRYAAYKDLKKLYLFDTVRVRDRRLNLFEAVRVSRIRWDCRREKMLEVELGALMDLAPSVSNFQIKGISGAKLAEGTVSAAALDDESINTRHIQAESINAEAIQAEAVTADHMAADTFTAGKAIVQKLNAHSLAAVIAELGSVTAATVSTNALAAGMASLFTVVADNITSRQITADALDAVIESVVTLSAGSAEFDAATVTHLLSNLLQVSRLYGSQARIDNLYVTEANIVNATLDRLCVQGSDGEYYDLSVNSGGQIAATLREVSPEEAAEGETRDGRGIVESTLDVEALDGLYLRDAETGLATLYTEAMDTGRLTAVEAFIGSAQIPQLQTTVVEAIGNSMTFSANQVIQLLAGVAEGVRTWFTFGNDGLRTRRHNPDGSYASKWSTLVGDDGYYIDHEDVPGHVGAFYRERFEARSVRLMRGLEAALIARPTSAGGWAWYDEGQQ